MIVANQWGRDAGPGGKSSGAMGVIFAIVISLVLGAAGSYAYVRFGTQPDTAALEALRAERDELTQQVQRQSGELDQMTEKLLAADSGKGDSDGRVATAEKARDEALAASKDLEEQLKALQQLTELTSGNAEVSDTQSKQLAEKLAAAEKSRDAALKDKASAEQQLADLEELTKLTAGEADASGEALKQQVTLAEKARDKALAEKSELAQQVARLTALVNEAETAAQKQGDGALKAAEQARDRAVADKATAEKQLSDLQELTKLTSGNNDAANTALSQKLATAETARDQALKDRGAFEKQIAALEKQLADLQELTKLTSGNNDAANAALSQKLTSTESARDQALKDKAVLEKQITALQQGAGGRQAAIDEELRTLKNKTVPDLQLLVDQRQAELIQADDARNKAVEQAKALEKQLDETRQAVAALQEEQGKGFEERLRLEAELAEAKQKLASATKPETQATRPTPLKTPRDAFNVERALSGAPGLDGLSSSDRLTLKQMLVTGECVTTSLESVLGKVPVISLRNLIRDLKSSC
ncbi:hypothetical protein LJR030_001477 [Rhizobium sp. LjRoot30]